MSLQSVVRLVSGMTALCSLTFLVVDFGFILLCPAQRGTIPYVVAQILFQVALVVLLAKRVIVIYH